MIKLMFVCHGNICRSTMAEFVMKDLVRKADLADKFIINSSATSREEIGCDTHYGTKVKLREMNIPFSKRKAVQITKQDYDMYDYIIHTYEHTGCPDRPVAVTCPISHKHCEALSIFYIRLSQILEDA